MYNSQEQEVQFKVGVDHDYFTNNIVDLMNTHGSNKYDILLDKFIEKCIDITVTGISKPTSYMDEYNTPTSTETSTETIDGCVITFYN